MNIAIPEINITDDTGFDEKLDIFKRKEYGERLAKLIESTEGL